ncbi:AraC family transcriptional regulator [Bacillaceae bacterium SAS-127]|nr:AraC family transcriptional regulator [Bacillaceae bacterium SAS-127]
MSKRGEVMMDGGFRDIFHQFFSRFQMKDSEMEKMSMDQSIGVGTFHQMTTYSGIKIILTDYSLHKGYEVHFSSKGSMVELSFCLRGRRGVEVTGLSYEVTPGNCYLQFMQDFDVSFTFDHRAPVYWLAIAVPVQVFNYMMSNEKSGSNIDFDSIIGNGPFRLFQQSIDSRMKYLINQILQYSPNSPMYHLYIESKVLELLSVYFQSFLLDDRISIEQSKLSKRDVEKVRKAKEILLNSMEAPPSIIELSRLVQLNDYKLKIGFKELYGTTAYKLLRHHRLEKAVELLQSGKMNVSQVAVYVGYGNLSYFSEVFKKTYGINPSELLRDDLLIAKMT